ncbi:MAG: hypothetical protein ACLGPM_00695 [Acidobacteriota bacterium]
MSQPAERRTLDELVARYDLEPELGDVYVEGMFDKDVLTRCFHDFGQMDRIVYEIDTVEIPMATLVREGLDEGNKQRVIALARILQRIEREIACRCLVDRDLDHWFGPLETTRTLVWTEHCSIELYFFTDAVLQELLIVAARAQIQDWRKFICSMTNALLDLYAMRLADRELGWSMQWLSTHKQLKAGPDQIEFNKEEYVRRLLLKNGRSKRAADFSATLAKRRSSLICDPRRAIRGHDLTDVLSWTIRAFKGLREIESVVAIERIFLLAVPRAPELIDLFSPPSLKKAPARKPPQSTKAASS